MLSTRDAVILLTAGIVSLAADSMALVALLLRVHAASASPYAAAGLLMCFALPVVALMGIAGGIGDRCDAKPVLVLGGLLQVAGAGALAFTSRYGATLAAVAVMQCGFALTNALWGAVVPRIVGEDLVGSLVSMQQGMRAIASPLGAGLGGALVQWHGDQVVMVVNAVSFAGLILAALLLRLPPHPVIDAPEPAPARVGVLPREGIVELRRHPLLTILVWALLPSIVTLESVNAVEVFLVRDILGATPFQFGLGETAAGAGAVLGAFGAGAVHDARRRVQGILLAMAIVPIAQIGQGLAPGFVVYLVLGAVVGLVLGLSNALIFTVLLTALPQYSTARVLAFVNGAARAMSLLALVLGGALNAVVGPRGAYVVTGGAGLVVVVVAVLRLRPHMPPCDRPAAKTVAGVEDLSRAAER